jgi:glucose-6-phosphate-specific signal transduction histidine kinase
VCDVAWFFLWCVASMLCRHKSVAICMQTTCVYLNLSGWPRV